MNRYIIVLAALVFMFSCKGPDNPKPVEPMPAFTCSDHSEEGKFENWNDAEWAAVAKLSGYTYPEYEIPGYVTVVGVNKLQISISDTALSYLASVNDSNCILQYALLNHDLGGASSSDVSSGPKINDTSRFYLKPDSWNITPGCYRLYYLFSQWNTKTVVTKGHFDIEFIP